MQPDGDGVRVVVSGEVDIAAVPSLTAQFDEVIETSSDAIVIDLADVTFMDSTGLVLLIETRRRLAGEDRQLVLARPSACVRRLFELTGLSELFVVSELDGQTHT